MRYVREFSTSVVAADLVMSLKPDFVFIDGDHSYQGVRHDYELVRVTPAMIMFHDICSDSWPGDGRLWRDLVGTKTYHTVEFVRQYPST